MPLAWKGEKRAFFILRVAMKFCVLFFMGVRQKFFFACKRCVKHVWGSYERFLLGRAILKIISRDAKLNGLKLPNTIFPRIL